MANKPRFIRLLLVQSRLLGVLLPCLLWGLVLPEHEAEAFRGLEPRASNATGDLLAQSLVKGLTRWDARHFLHIARFGYTYETNLAFLPLFPILTRFLTSAWFPLHILQDFYALATSAIILNAGAFLIAGYFLYQLSLRFLGKESSAYAALVAWALSPASIFFSAVYSESLYAALTFIGLDLLTREAGNLSAGAPLAASIVFGLAALTRANGLLNIFFIATALGFPWLAHVLGRRKRGWSLVSLPMLGLFCALLFLAPWAYQQVDIFHNFCSHHPPLLTPALERLGRWLDVPMPGELDRLPWCKRWLPISYAHVQAHYWDVGAFGYFQLRKLPNFLLAAPAITIAIYAVIHFDAIGAAGRDPLAATLLNRRSLIPLSLHLLFLTVAGAFFANVEVTTRILFSSSPLPYFALAEILPSAALTPPIIRSGSLPTAIRTLWTAADVWGKAALAYCLLYFVIGPAAHAAFLPWT